MRMPQPSDWAEDDAMTDKPMTVDEALRQAVIALENENGVPVQSEAADILTALRARLAADREAIRKVREDMAAFSAVATSQIGQSWLAALDRVLEGE